MPLDYSALTANRHYQCHLDYDSEHDCENKGCIEEGICRCGTIENAKILSLETYRIIQDFVYNNGLDKLTAYCIDRLIHRSEYAKPENWEVGICGGYYGEEIDDVLPNTEHVSAIKKKIDQLFILTPDERVEFVLKDEYGYLLPKLQQRSWCVKSVYLADVYISQPKHFDKLDQERIVYYIQCGDIASAVCAVCLADAHLYRLVDGYHRIATAMQLGYKQIDILVNK